MLELLFHIIDYSFSINLSLGGEFVNGHTMVSVFYLLGLTQSTSEVISKLSLLSFNFHTLPLMVKFSLFSCSDCLRAYAGLVDQMPDSFRTLG